MGLFRHRTHQFVDMEKLFTTQHDQAVAGRQPELMLFLQALEGFEQCRMVGVGIASAQLLAESCQ